MPTLAEVYAKMNDVAVRMGILTEKHDQNQSSIENAIEELRNTAIKPVPNITVTVGDGGEFATLLDAIEFASTYRNVLKDSSSMVITIRLLSGFVMKEQLIIQHGVDLSHIRLVADDPIVVVDPIQLQRSFAGTKPLFAATVNCFLPVIDCVFEFSEIGKENIHRGVSLHNNSSATFYANAGVKNAGERNVFLSESSTLSAHNCDFSHAGLEGVYATTNSRAFIHNTTVTGCGNFGIRVATLGQINASGVDASNANNHCVFAQSGGHIEFTNGIANGSVTGDGIYADSGSSINAPQSVANGNFLEGVASVGGSAVNISHANADNNMRYGVYAANAANINATGVISVGNGVRGLYALWGSNVCAVNANCRLIDGVDSTQDIVVGHGSSVSASNVIGGTNIAVNTLTSSGVIYQ